MHQTILLRLGAFVTDALTLCLLLILPGAMISYAVVLLGGSLKAVSLIWYGTLLVLCIGILFRDGYHGRSPGKRLLGLRITTTNHRTCSYPRSLVRNIPLLIPGWNLLELGLVLFSRSSRRTGDLIAGTFVTEE